MAETISRASPDALITLRVLQNNAKKATEGQSIRFLGSILKCSSSFYVDSFDSSMNCNPFVFTHYTGVDPVIWNVDSTPSESGPEVKALQIMCSPRKLQQYLLKDDPHVRVSFVHQDAERNVFPGAGYTRVWEGYN